MIHDSDHFINNFLQQCPTVAPNTEAHEEETASWDPWALSSMSFYNRYYLFSMRIIFVSICEVFSEY